MNIDKKILNIMLSLINSIRKNTNILIIVFVGIFIIHSQILYSDFTHADTLSIYTLESGFVIHNISIGRYIYALLLHIGNIFKFKYVVPYFNTFFALIILTFTSFIIIDVLNIKNRINRVLLMYIISASAAIGEVAWTTEMFCGAMISLFFATFSMYLIRDIELSNIKESFKLILLSIICLIISLGIYQAYIVVTVVLMIILLMKYAFDNVEFKKVFAKAFIYLIIIIISIIIYLLIFYVLIKLMNINVSARTKISINSVLRNIIKSYGSIYYFMFKEYARTTNLLLMNISYIYIFIAMLYMGIIFLIKCKIQKFLFIIFCILFPIAMNLPRFMTGDNGNLIRINMGFLFPFVLFICLYEYNKDKNIITDKILLNKNIVRTVLIIVLVCQFYLRQGDYQNYIDYTNRSRAYAIMMVERIKAINNYSIDKPVYFIGNSIKNKSDYYGKYLTMEDFWGFIPSLKRLAGFEFNEPTENKINELKKLDEVKRMPIYPADGSIKVINDVVIVKLDNIK